MSTLENKPRLIGRVGQRGGRVCGDELHIHIYYRPSENITLPRCLGQKGRDLVCEFLWTPIGVSIWWGLAGASAWMQDVGGRKLTGEWGCKSQFCFKRLCKFIADITLKIFNQITESRTRLPSNVLVMVQAIGSLFPKVDTGTTGQVQGSNPVVYSEVRGVKRNKTTTSWQVPRARPYLRAVEVLSSWMSSRRMMTRVWGERMQGTGSVGWVTVIYNSNKRLCFGLIFQNS